MKSTLHHPSTAALNDANADGDSVDDAGKVAAVITAVDVLNNGKCNYFCYSFSRNATDWSPRVTFVRNSKYVMCAIDITRSTIIPRCPQRNEHLCSYL